MNNRIFWINLILLGLAVGCQTSPEKILEPAQELGFKGKVYVGDSANSGIRRNAVDPVLSCNDKQFDKFICLSYDDFKNLMDKILKAGCADVPTPTSK